MSNSVRRYFASTRAVKMFSFFKRNKNPPKNNNAALPNDASAKVSQNMQSAIERQQACLQQTLERRKSNVNDREQKTAVSSPNTLIADDRYKNRSEALPSYDKISQPASGSCAPPKLQNYDQYRDAIRAGYIESASSRQAATPTYRLPNFESAPPNVVVASSITPDQKCFTDTALSYEEDVMGRGRNNRAKHRGPAFQQNQNKNTVKTQKNEDENVSKNVNDYRGVTCEKTIGVDVTKIGVERRNHGKSASAEENSEKSASISCENVFHDENSCSINSQQDNKNDNIATSDEGTKASASEATNIVSAHDEKNETLVESVAANAVKNNEHLAQQVGFPLQRNLSARRVTFAPSPPGSVASSMASDDEDNTLSDDIFYEAAESPSESQKLRILSTVTSHSNGDCTRIAEENSEAESSASTSKCSSSSSNDVVCAKIILSVNDEERKSDNDDRGDKNPQINAFSSDETSISSSFDIDSLPRTIKPSYLHVGEDTIALPDIVAETSLLEQHHHQQHQNDEM